MPLAPLRLFVRVCSFPLVPLVCLAVAARSDYLFKLLLIGDSSVGYVFR